MTLIMMLSSVPTEFTPRVALFVAFNEASKAPKRQPSPSAYWFVAKSTVKSSHPVVKFDVVCGSFMKTFILFPEGLAALVIVPLPWIVISKFDCDDPGFVYFL